MKPNVKNVTIYVIEGCPFCASALKWLDEHKVLYKKIVVPGDKSKRDDLDQFEEHFPEDPRGVPVIVVEEMDGKKHFFNDELDPLLENLLEA